MGMDWKDDPRKKGTPNSVRHLPGGSGAGGTERKGCFLTALALFVAPPAALLVIAMKLLGV